MEASEVVVSVQSGSSMFFDLVELYEVRIHWTKLYAVYVHIAQAHAVRASLITIDTFGADV